MVLFDAYTRDALPTDRGCAFLNAAGELPQEHPAFAVIRAHKRAVRERIEQLIRTDHPGIDDPADVADHLFLLIEGAIAHRGIDGDRLLDRARDRGPAAGDDVVWGGCLALRWDPTQRSSSGALPATTLALVCTRIFWNTNELAKTVSRCLDWAINDEPDLWFSPRGTSRTGDAGGGPHLDDISGTGTDRVEHAHTWTSRHASVGVTMWRLGTIDGLNEHGLAAHTLYLNPEDAGFEPVDERPAVAHIQWAQYVLDHYATVAEVIADLGRVRIASPRIRGEHMGAHLAIEDPSGDSAIIEPIGGRLVVHHGPEFRVMSNSPSLDQQLANLSRYRPFGGDQDPPGDISSLDRFVRANYFLHYLPEPESTAEAVAGVFQLIENVSVPYGAPYTDGSVYPTWWHSGADLTNGVYYFESTRSPSVFWIDLAELAASADLADLAAGGRVLRLNPRDVSLVGDETERLRGSAA